MREDTLAAVLSEFARTLISDFSIQGILDRLVDRVVDVLPVDAAGVTLIAPGVLPHYIAASSPLALESEQLQTDTGEGPCLLAYHAGEEILVPDLRDEQRFPRFVASALANGLAAVFAFPLRHGDGRIGVLDLYREQPGHLEPADIAAAWTLADVAAAYLINAEARERERETSDRFRRSALHDSLTGLPNRVLLQERLDHTVDRARRSHSVTAVLFVDLDRFKRVNDEFGHAVGDQLLMAVAARLRAVVRPGDTVARVHGDEFVIVLEDMADAGVAERLAVRVVGAFAEPFALPDVEVPVQVTASVGVAYAGPGEQVSKDLLVNADIAMYQAKRGGGGHHQVLDLRGARRHSDRRQLQRDLADALAHEKLDVAYQPILGTHDGSLSQVEALVRWSRPGHGPLPSHAMVDVAEESGLILDVGEWVLERACRDRREWLRERSDLRPAVCVNVSKRQLAEAGFVGTVADVLERTDTEPPGVVLEVTEGAFLDDAARAMTVLTDLKDLGVQLAFDNFGTGYSAVSHLRRFPVDIVKLDLALTADAGRIPNGTPLIRALTELAHSAGRSVTVQGVETPLQHAEIATVGCERVQGFCYARPMSNHDLRVSLHQYPQVSALASATG